MLGLAAGLSAACAGSGPSAEEPTASLASSVEAQARFRPLRKSWSVSSREERGKLEPEIERFRAAFPTDALTRVADVFLAWIALDRGDLARAEALARRVQVSSAGTTTNLALVIEGGVLNRRRRHQEALQRLSPLVNKLIDAYARELLNEELVVAALGARRWDKAAQFMTLWLGEADERALVRPRIEALAADIPPEELARLLVRRPDQADLTADEREIAEMLAQRLATIAREKKDVRLAKQLLSSSGALLGQQGNAVAQLAQGASAARVEAPTVGLLLSLRDDETRRRGVDVAAGVAHALGVPGSEARLVSRDEGGSLDHVEDALVALSADGAGVVVAGVDRAEADAVARFAALRELPVVLLRPPTVPTASPFVFVLGEDASAVRDALVVGLAARGAEPIATVEDAGAPQSVAHATDSGRGVIASATCDASAPAAAWKRQGIAGVVLQAPPPCVSTALAAIKAADLRVKLAYGLDLGPVRPPAGALTATAGAYPIDASTTESSEQLRHWLSARRSAPGWWVGLGHDAALLAWESVRGLPDQPTDDPGEVKARRLRVATALAHATGDLWTTEARGFGGARTLPRRLGVREVR